MNLTPEQEKFFRHIQPAIENHLIHRTNPHLVRAEQLEPGAISGALVHHFNPDQKDINFVYDSVTFENFFFLDATLNRMGLGGTINPAGLLHVYDSAAGGSAASYADALILEVGPSGGMSFLNTNTGVAYIVWGDIADSDAFNMSFNHNTNLFQYQFNNQTYFQIAQLEQTFNPSSNDVDFSVFGLNKDDLIFVDAGNDKVGFGINAPDGFVHVHNASAGTVSASLSADDLIVENNSSAGISILTPNNVSAFIIMGDPDDNDVFIIQYNHVNDSFIVTGNATEWFRMASTDTYFNRTNQDIDFRVSTTGHDYTLHVNGGTNRVGIYTNNPSSVLHVAHTSSGVLVGASPTGGDKGAGTINVSGNIYKNNSAYTNPDYVLEHWVTGQIERFKDNPRAKDFEPMDIYQIENYINENMRLPGISDEPSGIFDMADIALELIERLFTLIIDLNYKVDNLTRRLGT